MAEGKTTNTAWLQSPKWYESKKGEVTEKISDVQANFIIGVGVVVCPYGRTEAVEVKEFEQKSSGETSYIVKVTLAMYNRNYETLISFGNTPLSRIMLHIEKGDYVLFFGKKKKCNYKNRKGEQKEKTEVCVSFVLPLGHIEAIQEVYMNQNIQAVMNGGMPNLTEATAEADVMESAEFDEDAYENETEFEIPDEDEFETITAGLPFV